MALRIGATRRLPNHISSYFDIQAASMVPRLQNKFTIAIAEILFSSPDRLDHLDRDDGPMIYLPSNPGNRNSTGSAKPGILDRGLATLCGSLAKSSSNWHVRPDSHGKLNEFISDLKFSGPNRCHRKREPVLLNTCMSNQTR